mmetsp:Transcript_16358/g.40009  ORF Transcript_16358/g.40009 Transcript_16358/m.40009 type:complete len:314 (+) Transcript_16358:1516-2457(+)
MCRMQNSSMPSFSNPFSLGSWYHTLPRIREVTMAENMRAVTNSLLRTVTVTWRASTERKCEAYECGYATPYWLLANGVLSSTASGAAAGAAPGANSGDARHAAASALVVTGAPEEARLASFKELPFINAFWGVATRFTNQSAMSSPLPGLGATKPSLVKCSTALSRGPWYTGAPSRSSISWSNWLNTSGVGCSSAMTAVPLVVRAHSRSAAMMLYVTAASSPVLISSMHSSRTLVTSASATVTRFFSPPLTPRTRSLPMMVLMQPSRASSEVTARSLSACSAGSAGAGVLFSWLNCAVSLTLRKGRCVSTCST